MNSDPLLAAFAEQVGVSEDEARPALERVVAALRATLDTGADATLEGVGTFSRGSEGASFHSDALLVATVNGEFAGLGPVSEPVPVPFLTSFPVVPAAEVVEPDITPVDVADDSAAELAPPRPAMVSPVHVDPDAGVDDDLTIELGPNDDVAGPDRVDEEHDRDLSDVMAGVWAPPPSPPVAPLHSPASEFPSTADEDQSTLTLEEAGFSFVDAPPAPAESAAPPPITPVVAAPFAATATVAPATAPALHAVTDESGDDGRWSKLWLVVPLVAIVAAGLWLMSRRDSAGDDAGEPLASQPGTGSSGSGVPLGAGGAPADSSADTTAATASEALDTDDLTAANQVAQEADVATGAPSTPPSRDGAGAYRPAPIRLAPVPARTPPRDDAAVAGQPPDDEPAPTRTTPARTQVARENPGPEPAASRPRPVQEPELAAGASAWGMRGSVPVDPTAGGMTWVLASTDAADARERVAIYRSLGFRAAVLPALVDGRQVYRVAVGQFAGSAEAHAARSLLPNDAPTDAWLLRLGRTP